MESAKIVIRHAEGSEDMGIIRRLFANYGTYLAANPTGEAKICIQNYERELNALPGLYAPPHGVLLLALADGVRVGCCALKPIRPTASGMPDEEAVELKRLWVEPSARGVHLGRLLVEAAVAHAESLGRTSIYLNTVPAAMPEANRLYETLGFEHTERHNKNPVRNVVFFRKPLRRLTADE